MSGEQLTLFDVEDEPAVKPVRKNRKNGGSVKGGKKRGKKNTPHPNTPTTANGMTTEEFLRRAEESERKRAEHSRIVEENRRRQHEWWNSVHRMQAEYRRSHPPVTVSHPPVGCCEKCGRSFYLLGQNERTEDAAYPLAPLTVCETGGGWWDCPDCHHMLAHYDSPVDPMLTKVEDWMPMSRLVMNGDGRTFTAEKVGWKGSF